MEGGRKRGWQFDKGNRRKSAVPLWEVLLQILHLSYTFRTSLPLRKAVVPVIVRHFDCNHRYQFAATATRSSIYRAKNQDRHLHCIEGSLVVHSYQDLNLQAVVTE